MVAAAAWRTACDIASGVLDLLYPPYCLVCNTLGEEIICPICADSLITPVPPPYCLRCGQIQNGAECTKCVDYPRELIRCRAVGVYSGSLADLLHQLKYRDRPMLAGPLSAFMDDYLKVRAEIMNDLHFDAIVPVPLHKSRKKKRGYNQSQLLAEELGKRLGIQVEARALTRVRNTKSQVGKKRAERLDNLENAFLADRRKCHGKTYLLLDDVSTTGSTLRECAKALREAGATKIYAITMAAG